MSVRVTRKKRGKLFKRVSTTASLGPDSTREDIRAAMAVMRAAGGDDLGTLICEAAGILKRRGLASEWPACRSLYDEKDTLPVDAGLALDVLFYAHNAQDHLNNERPQDAVWCALRAGQYWAMLMAEAAVLARDTQKTRRANQGRKQTAEQRRRRILEIKRELFGDKPLTHHDRQTLKRHIQQQINVSDSTLNRDLKTLSL